MEIPFTVSARTAKLIGLENFSNPEGAIVELVKNTYDADSRYCFLLFDKENDTPCIYLLDYGCGMTADIIINSWMCIGTDNKLYDEYSKNGRVKSGAKGIGRFALNRLGTVSQMWTYADETEEGHVWSVDWNKFDTPHAIVSDVKATLEEISLDDITKRVNIVLSYFSLSASPEFKHGTLLKISNLNDAWDETIVNKLYENLKGLIPPFDIPAFEIFMHSTDAPCDYGKVEIDSYSDFDYKVSAHYLGDINRTLEVDITRNELDVQRLKSEYAGVFEYSEMKQYPYSLDVFEKGTFHQTLSLKDLKIDKKQRIDEYGEKIGKFDFTFYFAKNTIRDVKGEGDRSKFPYKPIPIGRRAWLQQNLGVKIYRDNFRVRPYGENGDDWLRLGERYTTNPSGAGQRRGGYFIRQNQIVGAVEISRVYNKYLEDKSSREGLQENEIFDLFKDILIGIIGLFEKDRNIVMYNLSQLYDKNNPKGKAKHEAEEAAKSGYSNENYEKVRTGYEAIKQELDEKEDELSLLRNLASTGLVITSFSHELRNIRALLDSRSLDIKEALENIITNEEIIQRGIDPYENPYNMIEELSIQDQKIRGWLEFSLNSIRRNKRENTIINLSTYFSSFKNTWQSVLSELNIELMIEGFTEEMNIKAMQIDLDTIFNNLLSNSIYAIKETKSNQNRNITIKGNCTGNIVQISFVDTGIGLAEEYKSHVNDIFNAFESSKVDEEGNKIGTGLGLYITKTTIEKYKGDISIIPNMVQGFGLIVSLNKV